MLYKVLLFSGALLAIMAGLAWWLTQPLLGISKPEFPCETVDPAHLRESVEFLVTQTGKRNFYHPEVLEKAAGFIEKGFRQAGGIVRSDDFEVGGERFRNVVARFGPSTQPVIVIGAHYDADVHTPGADDNASGVASLLELARLLGQKPPLNSVELVAYTLEEMPNFGTENMGSWHHAMRLAQEGVIPKAVIVLEMIGYFDDRPQSQSFPVPGMEYLYPDRGHFIGVVSDFSSPRLVRRVKAAMSACAQLPVYSLNAPVWVPGVALSDHSSYWAHGVPAVMITDTAYLRNPNYHQASDLPDTLDYDRMGKVVRGVISTLRAFDVEH
ncbi:MAG: M28 family peptidase [Candidatus Competibacter sp.]